MTASLFAGAVLMLGAITPAKVADVATPAPAPQHPPHLIYVDSFSIDPILTQAAQDEDNASNNGGDDSGGGRPHLFGILRGGEQNTMLGRRKERQYQDTLQKLPGILQKALIDDLSNGVAPAAGGNGSSASRQDCWVVTGQFVVVNPGNRAMQAGVGFGAGQSHVEVRVQVYSLRDKNTPFLVFDSAGASGHTPGAVMIPNPYVAAAKFVMSKNEPEKESKKIAASIAKEIGKFMTAQGIPTLEQVQSGAPGPASASTPTNQSSKGH